MTELSFVIPKLLMTLKRNTPNQFLYDRLVPTFLLK